MTALESRPVRLADRAGKARITAPAPLSASDPRRAGSQPMAPCLHRPPCGKLVAVPGVRHAPTSVGVRPLPWKTCKASGISSAGRLGNRWFLASRGTLRAWDALNFPARPRFAFAQRRSRKRPKGLAASRSTAAGLVVPSLPSRELPARRFVTGATVLDKAHRGEDAAVEGAAHRRPLLIDGAAPLTEMNAGSVRAPLEHQLAIRAPLRQQGGPGASYRASRPRRRRGSSSKPCTLRTGQAPRLRAPRPPGSPAECSPLSACPRPSLSVSSHPSRAILGVGYERRPADSHRRQIGSLGCRCAEWRPPIVGQ
jgi:hypothetical protein